MPTVSGVDVIIYYATFRTAYRAAYRAVYAIAAFPSIFQKQRCYINNEHHIFIGNKMKIPLNASQWFNIYIFVVTRPI